MLTSDSTESLESGMALVVRVAAEDAEGPIVIGGIVTL
jgi:hypothetical protein